MNFFLQQTEESLGIFFPWKKLNFGNFREVSSSETAKTEKLKLLSPYWGHNNNKEGKKLAPNLPVGHKQGGREKSFLFGSLGHYLKL